MEKRGCGRSRIAFLALTAAILLQLPSMAEAVVVISCYDLGGGIGEVQYDASGESELVRAFALDLEVGGGATIESLFDMSSDYWVFPGTIIIDPNGDIISDNPYTDIGQSEFTVEMGSLYGSSFPDHPLPPPATGTLFRFDVDFHGAFETTLSISPNAAAGGVVLEDATQASVQSIGCTLTPEPGTLMLLGLGGLLLRHRRG